MIYYNQGYIDNIIIAIRTILQNGTIFPTLWIMWAFSKSRVVSKFHELPSIVNWDDLHYHPCPIFYFRFSVHFLSCRRGETISRQQSFGHCSRFFRCPHSSEILVL
jgi:hypothetical protein